MRFYYGAIVSKATGNQLNIFFELGLCDLDLEKGQKRCKGITKNIYMMGVNWI